MKEVEMDNKYISSLRVVDLKEELEKRGLSKSGSKKDLCERLKTFVRLQKERELSATRNDDEAPNNKLQMVEGLGNNDLIKQYLAKQQALLIERKASRPSAEGSAAADVSSDMSPLQSPEKSAVSISPSLSRESGPVQHVSPRSSRRNRQRASTSYAETVEDDGDEDDGDYSARRRVSRRCSSTDEEPRSRTTRRSSGAVAADRSSGLDGRHDLPEAAIVMSRVKVDDGKRAHGEQTTGTSATVEQLCAPDDSAGSRSVGDSKQTKQERQAKRVSKSEVTGSGEQELLKSPEGEVRVMSQSNDKETGDSSETAVDKPIQIGEKTDSQPGVTKKLPVAAETVDKPLPRTGECSSMESKTPGVEKHMEIAAGERKDANDQSAKPSPNRDGSKKEHHSGSGTVPETPTMLTGGDNSIEPKTLDLSQKKPSISVGVDLSCHSKRKMTTPAKLIGLSEDDARSATSSDSVRKQADKKLSVDEDQSRSDHSRSSVVRHARELQQVNVEEGKWGGKEEEMEEQKCTGKKDDESAKVPEEEKCDNLGKKSDSSLRTEEPVDQMKLERDKMLIERKETIVNTGDISASRETTTETEETVKKSDKTNTAEHLSEHKKVRQCSSPAITNDNSVSEVAPSIEKTPQESNTTTEAVPGVQNTSQNSEIASKAVASEEKTSQDSDHVISSSAQKDDGGGKSVEDRSKSHKVARKLRRPDHKSAKSSPGVSANDSKSCQDSVESEPSSSVAKPTCNTVKENCDVSNDGMSAEAEGRSTAKHSDVPQDQKDVSGEEKVVENAADSRQSDSASPDDGDLLEMDIPGQGDWREDSSFWNPSAEKEPFSKESSRNTHVTSDVQPTRDSRDDATSEDRRRLKLKSKRSHTALPFRSTTVEKDGEGGDSDGTSTTADITNNSHLLTTSNSDSQQHAATSQISYIPVTNRRIVLKRKYSDNSTSNKRHHDDDDGKHDEGRQSGSRWSCPDLGDSHHPVSLSSSTLQKLTGIVPQMSDDTKDDDDNGKPDHISDDNDDSIDQRSNDNNHEDDHHRHDEKRSQGEEQEKKKEDTSPPALIKRTISQNVQGEVGVSCDRVMTQLHTQREPSPARNHRSTVVFVRNLVRPFTVNQLRELLARTGTITAFWIDNIKSKCYCQYENVEQAVETRTALHRVRWPPSNPKRLLVDYGSEQQLQQALQPSSCAGELAAAGGAPEQPVDPQFATRQQEQQRQQRAHQLRRENVREWDKVKLDERSPGEKERERERRKRQREEENEDAGAKHNNSKPDKRQNRVDNLDDNGAVRQPSDLMKTTSGETETPVKLLDDLFRKTQCTPCIYWLPLSDEQIAEREQMRQKRIAERQKRRAEQQQQRQQPRRSRSHSRRR